VDHICLLHLHCSPHHCSTSLVLNLWLNEVTSKFELVFFMNSAYAETYTSMGIDVEVFICALPQNLVA
jgi:hypothetical protein